MFIMVRLFFLMLLLVAVSACQDKDIEPRFINYSDGTKQASFFVNKKGDMVGPYTEYYRSSKIKSVKVFENNLEQGKGIHYYETGELREVQYFVQGKKHGGDTLYEIDGKFRNLSYFDHGKMNGTFIKYKDSMDSIELESVYIQDSLVSIKKY